MASYLKPGLHKFRSRFREYLQSCFGKRIPIIILAIHAEGSPAKKGRRMKYIKHISLILIVFLLIIGCSGNYANIKNLSESESKAIQQELLDNWSDYNISYDVRVIVFDPKNDEKKILVHSRWQTVKDQETWTQIVNGTIIVSPQWRAGEVWGDPIREIWVHNQFYGYVSHKKSAVVAAKIVDENTVFLNRQWGNLTADP